MTKEEIKISEKIDNDKILTQTDIEKFEEYCAAVKHDLEASELSKSKQKEIFETLAYHEKVRLATNRLGAKMREIGKELDAINEKYKKEPNDAKAAKLAQEHAKKKAKGEQLKKIRKTYLDEFHRTTKDAQRCDAELNQALKDKGLKYEGRGTAHKKAKVSRTPFERTNVRSAK